MSMPALTRIPLKYHRRFVMGVLLLIVGCEAVLMASFFSESSWWYLLLVPVVAVAAFVMRLEGFVEVHADHLLVKRPRESRVETIPMPAKSCVILERTAEGSGKNEHVWFDVCLDQRRVVRDVYHLPARQLAEALSRASGRPFVDATGDGVSSKLVKIEPIDLGLPLRERMRRYPEMRIASKERPVGIYEPLPADGSRVLRWRFLTSTLIAIVGFVGVFVILGYFMPGKRGPSEFSRHGWEGFLGYAKLMVTLFGGLLAICAGATITLTVNDRRARRTAALFGIPLWVSSIPTAHVEDVRWVGDDTVKIISDRRIISLRTWFLGMEDRVNAAWLTAELQREIASRQ